MRKRTRAPFDHRRTIARIELAARAIELFSVNHGERGSGGIDQPARLLPRNEAAETL